jgi:carbonic anhydrase
MDSHVSDGNQPACTAEEALARLEEGNARFLGGHARFPTVPKEVLVGLARGQRPYATILGCSDSRVPTELVFDAAFGELFVIRVAGNVLGPSIAGTLQYAGTHLHTPLFVVMGHEGCGAVEAAIASKVHGARHRSRIALLLENIVPALNDLDLTLPPAALLSAAVEANVRWTLRAMRESPEGKVTLAQGHVKLVGAVYDLATGRVRFLE